MGPNDHASSSFWTQGRSKADSQGRTRSIRPIVPFLAEMPWAARFWSKWGYWRCCWIEPAPSGSPEARIPLAQAAVYIATAPKSNAAIKGIDQALKAVRNETISSVPNHLQDKHYQGAKELERGKGYKYPHSYSQNYVEQQYLPDELKGKKFYNPENQGYEKKIKKFLDDLKQD